MFTEAEIFESLNQKLEQVLFEQRLAILDEVAMKRVVRGGKIVKKVKAKKKGFKVVRKGNAVKFVRMTAKEKRSRRKAARKAWKTGKAARTNKAKRSIRKSKVRMKTLYGHRKAK